MIQRVQTIFLILTAFVFGALFKVPFAISDAPASGYLADSVFNVNDHPVLLVLTIAGILIALVTIFMYRKRKVQLKFGYLTIVVAILLPVVAFLLFTSGSANTPASVEVADQLGLFLPLAAVLFTSLANHYIRKDENLVKSMDRLR